MAAADDAAGVTASIEVYSGRGIISWDMTPQERTELVSLIQKLPQVELKKIPSEGYVLIKNHGDTSFPYTQVYVFTNGIIIAEAGTSKTSYLDQRGVVMNWLLEQGNKHDPLYTPPKYRTLPEGTPYIAYTPESYSETAAQGTPLQLRLTVFSEGNAPLNGSLEAPEYLQADKNTINLPAIDGIEDYTFSVDTGSAGEKNGEIILRTNDPSRKEIRIPVKVTVTKEPAEPAAAESTGPSEKPNGRTGYLFCLIVLAVLAVVAFAVYVKKKAKK